MKERKSLPGWIAGVLITIALLCSATASWWLYSQGASLSIVTLGFFFALVVLFLLYDIFALLFGFELVSLEFIVGLFTIV